MPFNDWTKTPIIHKSNIKNFTYLIETDSIKMLEDDYYYIINKDYELMYYKKINKEIADRMEIENVEKTIDKYIKNLNTYNEVKDILDAMIGKIAEYRRVSIMEVREELELND